MLSWDTTPLRNGIKSHIARTALGTAIIYERPATGDVFMTMWRPDQTNIGSWKFRSVDDAQDRAGTILDPRATAWELLDDPALDDLALV